MHLSRFIVHCLSSFKVFIEVKKLPPLTFKSESALVRKCAVEAVTEEQCNCISPKSSHVFLTHCPGTQKK